MKKQIVLDLNKVQYAEFFWKNQFGEVTKNKPKYPSVHLKHIQKNEIALAHYDYPGETMRERAMRLDIIDIFKAVVRFQLSANHAVTYTGNKAKEMWKTWNAKIFGKKTNEHNKPSK